MTNFGSVSPEPEGRRLDSSPRRRALPIVRLLNVYALVIGSLMAATMLGCLIFMFVYVWGLIL